MKEERKRNHMMEHFKGTRRGLQQQEKIEERDLRGDDGPEMNGIEGEEDDCHSDHWKWLEWEEEDPIHLMPSNQRLLHPNHRLKRK